MEEFNLEAMSVEELDALLKAVEAKLKQLAVPVSGAVEHPQTLRVNWGMRLSGAVALAGGTVGAADDHRVEIRRGDETKSYDILAAQRTGDLSQDPVLQQGDRVFVPWVDRSKPQVLVGLQDGGVVNTAWDESLALAYYLTWAGELDRPSDAKAVRVDEVSPERVEDLVRSVISECIAKGRCNLADDIVRQGVLLTGGGALTPGLADAMQSALNLPVRVADDPRLAVILGAGVVLGELDALSRPKAKAPSRWTGLLIFAIVMLSLCRMHGLINRVIDLFVR